MENTIDGLKQLVKCIKNNNIAVIDLNNKRKELLLQFITSIEEAFYNGNDDDGFLDFNSIELDFTGGYLSFKISYPDDCADNYTLPIEAFLSGDTLRKCQSDKIKQLKKEEESRKLASIEKAERELLNILKKKYESNL